MAGKIKDRKLTHARPAAERLARRWFREAGVPLHYIGFSDNDGFYLVIHCLVGRKRVTEIAVPCWGVRTLRRCVDEAIEEFKHATTVGA